MKTEKIINDNTNIWIKQSDFSNRIDVLSEIARLNLSGINFRHYGHSNDFVDKLIRNPIVRKIRLEDESIIDLEVSELVIKVKFLHLTDLEKKEQTLEVVFCSENLFMALKPIIFSCSKNNKEIGIPEEVFCIKDLSSVLRCNIFSFSINDKEIGIPKEYLVDYFPNKELEILDNIINKYKKILCFA